MICELPTHILMGGFYVPFNKNVRIDLTNVNTQFTIDELVEETGMARHNVYQQLQSLISEHTVQVVGEHKVDGQRGRAKKIYAKVGV
jgi:predicted ArsR family transcriptional regulator